MKAQKLKKQCTMAYGYASARLALNYYAFEDDLSDVEQLPELFGDCTDKFRSCLAAYLQGQLPDEEISQLRRRVIGELEKVSAYTACFRVYEYVLNRMERKFNLDLKPEDQRGIVDELMRFIVSSENTAVFNHRVSSVIAELPVRFTRQKFYAMVREALSVYLGSDKESVNQMMYILRDISLTGLPADMSQGYEELAEILKQFQAMNFKIMDAAGYQAATQKITCASERLNQYILWFMSLQELINDLYILVLSKDRAMINLEEVKNVHTVFEQLLEKAAHGTNEELEEQMISGLSAMEGVQEAYYEKYQRCIADFPEVEGDDSKEAKISRVIEQLMSSSSYFLLEDFQPETGEVDKAWLDETIGKFFRDLDELFVKSPKPVVRAIMAGVLSELPLRFNQMEEVETYITNSLGSCADAAEKDACIELLRQIMESENALV